MKKGLLIAVILLMLATCVLAVTEEKLVPRRTNFMGDNVHIILIQDLSEKLDTQIATLDVKLTEMETKLNELEQIKSNLNKPVEVSTTGLATQYNSINSEIRDIRTSINELNALKQELKEPEPKKDNVWCACFPDQLKRVGMKNIQYRDRENK